MSELIQGCSNNPFSQSATRTFNFCVPDEWYRRPVPRISSAAPSESTLRHFEEMEEEDTEDGTAKQKGLATSQIHSPSKPKTDFSESTGTFSTKRLSSLFDGWLGSTTSPVSQDEGNERTRPIVSEPLSITDENSERGNVNKTNFLSGNDSDSSIDDEDFERMIVGPISISFYHTP